MAVRNRVSTNPMKWVQLEAGVSSAQSGICFRMVWLENQTTKTSKTAKNLR